VLDPCNESWPVCTTQVGCILGPESYAEGTFPRTFGFIVQLQEPSTVNLSLFVDNPTAAGMLTAETFNETGCTSHVEVDTTGQVFVTESQTQGIFTRSADLADIGDHLIQVTSDARAAYLVKVDIISKRDQ